MDEGFSVDDGVVGLRYEDLAAGRNLGAAIERAYGPDGLGLLVVRGVPDFVALRARLLPLGFAFAALPDAVTGKCVHPKSNYSFGWSAGKELLKPGVYDEFKGSYYANPQYDVPCTDAEEIARSPEVSHPNVWPEGSDFPELRPAFMALGQRMVDVGVLVAAQCDRFVESRLGARFAREMHLARIIEESRACKARLLQYFAIDDGDASPRARDSWCGWHTDHGSLTALCPAMYFEAEPGAKSPARKDFPVPDPDAGLYVRTRRGGERKVVIPRDAIAFQIGESSQIMTGGLLRATPHAVQALSWPKSRGVSRATFAVFMQPDGAVPMRVPEGSSAEHAEVGAYRAGMTFADFAKATFANYY